MLNSLPKVVSPTSHHTSQIRIPNSSWTRITCKGGVRFSLSSRCFCVNREINRDRLASPSRPLCFEALRVLRGRSERTRQRVQPSESEDPADRATRVFSLHGGREKRDCEGERRRRQLRLPGPGPDLCACELSRRGRNFTHARARERDSETGGKGNNINVLVAS